MSKRIKWTKLTVCLLLLSVAFSALLLHRWRAVSEPAEVRWKITTEKSAEQVDVEKININTADAEQLELLPGIGEKLADRIVTYRRENGAFSSPEDLLNVSGIGEETLAKMQDYIMF